VAWAARRAVAITTIDVAPPQAAKCFPQSGWPVASVTPESTPSPARIPKGCSGVLGHEVARLVEALGERG